MILSADKINCNTFSSPLPTVDRPTENKKPPSATADRGQTCGSEYRIK